ncbi:hypothetical protein CANMA_004448 [Candida margitis]|uniref:uncharacterized protein n=1 Tax=Candida margitis TaxID=1775924 RepID=UPI0022272AE7|nr:uncharacterized protein CANMA_004448 [Candida margitis]KAI5957035.1 hypothetical protein CANMA_004448 [Candida margitis]
MTVRQATHAGSWYSGDPKTLQSQIQALILAAQKSGNVAANKTVNGARVLVGPHAGYTYSGERLGEAFNAWDTSTVKRVFLLGPSHHVYFKDKALLSPFDFYETPLGDIPVDKETINDLLKKKFKKKHGQPVFKLMSEEIDEDEHSFEMHAPFIYHQGKNSKHGVPKIIPILISGMDLELSNELVDALYPYIQDEENHFIISSDFCHWGSRFGYTKVLANRDATLDSLETDIHSLRYSLGSQDIPVYQSIEMLDRMALQIASKGSASEWREYIRVSGNTICGQKPIAVMLQLLEQYGLKEGGDVFKWIGYSQSNHAKSPKDSSVSYAAGYVKL